jgi:uncharacterized membrane protein YjjP (DUF1212 family)
MDEIERRARFDAQRKTEAEGRVADSMEVRLEIVRRIEAGEVSLEEGQAELRRIKRNAKRDGKITRNQAFLGR